MTRTIIVLILVLAALSPRARFISVLVGADPHVRPGADTRVGPYVEQRASDPAREKRLEWFRDAKYGLFIHWGLYAIPAGEWQGKRSLGIGEWIMFRMPVPVREYEKLASQFNPVKYNPDEWVKMAKDAGMK